MWRFPRFLNALEAHLLGSAVSEEAATDLRAYINDPPRSAPGRASTAAASQRRPRRAMTRAQAQATQSDDEAFQREMSRGR